MASYDDYWYLSRYSLNGAALTFFAIGLISSLVFLGCLAYSLRRKHNAAKRLPGQAFALSLFLWILFFIFDIACYALNYDLGAMFDNPSLYAALVILQDFFSWTATCLVFYIYYTLIHRFLALAKLRLSTPSWRMYHWVWIGAVIILACLGFAFKTVQHLQEEGNLSTEINLDFRIIANSRVVADGVILASSWELIPWVIYLFVKDPTCLGGNKLPTLFLLLGVIFWALCKFFQSINDILRIYPADLYASANTITIQTSVLYICEIVTLIAFSLFLLLLFMKGAKLADMHEAEAGSDEESKDSGPSTSELPDDNSRLAASGVVPTTFFAELEGSQSQVFEANAADNQRFEVEAKQARFELGSEDLNGR
ncbi:uncharacterized protein BDV14DRAFT_51426 [Aspergillus stella-maris]|uniref:uncharacterized protein n=1 Tax=Aspergillus stella-maris TaxID=1810926 RepID=UPI003CCDF6AE